MIDYAQHAWKAIKQELELPGALSYFVVVCFICLLMWFQAVIKSRISMQELEHLCDSKSYSYINVITVVSLM